MVEMGPCRLICTAASLNNSLDNKHDLGWMALVCRESGETLVRLLSCYEFCRRWPTKGRDQRYGGGGVLDIWLSKQHQPRCNLDTPSRSHGSKWNVSTPCLAEPRGTRMHSKGEVRPGPRMQMDSETSFSLFGPSVESKPAICSTCTLYETSDLIDRENEKVLTDMVFPCTSFHITATCRPCPH